MKKKILSILLAFVMVLSIAPVSVFAEDDILSYLTYEINEGEVIITDCDESISGDVVIPDTIEGYPVTTKLDKIEGVFETAANYDGKDTVSTSDARMILRKAAGLE